MVPLNVCVKCISGLECNEDFKILVFGRQYECYHSDLTTKERIVSFPYMCSNTALMTQFQNTYQNYGGS